MKHSNRQQEGAICKLETEWKIVLSDITQDKELEKYLSAIQFPVLKDLSTTKNPLLLHVDNSVRQKNIEELLAPPIESKLSTLAGKKIQVEFRSSNDSGLWPSEHFTFNNFIKGNSNKLAHTAANAILNKPGKTNPLFVTGETGCGKSHFVQAIANEFLTNSPALKIVHLTMDSFRHLYRQITEKKSISLKNKLRKGDLFIFEDFEFHKKSSASLLEELYFLFHSYYENGKQIIITSTTPLDQQEIPSRWMSRMKSGLEVKIQNPDHSMRVEALIKKLRDYDIEVDHSQVLYWSRQLNNKSFRDLESLVTKIYFDHISGSINGHKSPKPDPKTIIQIVSDWFQIQEQDVLSNSRKAEIALPRHIAMYLSVKYTGLNKSAIARAFNRTDHSTVIHADKKIRALLQKDSELVQTLELLSKQLG